MQNPYMDRESDNPLHPPQKKRRKAKTKEINPQERDKIWEQSSATEHVPVYEAPDLITNMRERGKCSHGASEIAQQGQAAAQFPAPMAEGWQLRPVTPAPMDLMPSSGCFRHPYYSTMILS